MPEPRRRLPGRVRLYWHVTAAWAVTQAVVGLVVVRALVDRSVTSRWPDMLPSWVTPTVDRLPWAVAAVGAFYAVIHPNARFRRFRWDVNEAGLYVRDGWLVRRWTLLPREGVQGVDRRQSALQALVGISSVKVRTTRQSVDLDGLDADDAAALQAELSVRPFGQQRV